MRDCPSARVAGMTRTGPENGHSIQEDTMGKTGRKRRARRKKGANHGKRPNS